MITEVFMLGAWLSLLMDPSTRGVGIVRQLELREEKRLAIWQLVRLRGLRGLIGRKLDWDRQSSRFYFHLHKKRSIWFMFLVPKSIVVLIGLGDQTLVLSTGSIVRFANLGEILSSAVVRYS